MQQRNSLILFMFLSMLILLGWTFLQNRIWPPGERKGEKDRQQQEARKKAWNKLSSTQKQSTLIAGFVGEQASPTGVLGAGLRLGLDRGFAALFLAPPKAATRWEDLLSEHRSAAHHKAYTMLPPGPTFNLLAQLGAVHAIVETKAETVETVMLGGGKYYVQALLTTRGAGVQRLTLNKFEGTDWLGRSTNKPLELIGEDAETPSFLMFHYANAGDARPVSTLGQMIWKLEDQVADSDGAVKEVRFSAKVPDPTFRHLTIHKTYKLEPTEYHITLRIDIESAPGTAEGGERFRYQLVGSHGMPIEGEWYSPKYRDAVVGMVDGRGTLWRDLEDNTRISYQQGGEPVPDPKVGRGDSYLQYAGVMTQFFASLIVVDNKQPSKDDGGVDMRKILAWSRPTLESTEKKGRILKLSEHTLVLGSTERGGDTILFHLLPRTSKHVKDLELHEGSEVLVAYYQTEQGKHVATWIRPGITYHPTFDDITVRVNSDPIELQPGSKVTHQFMLYHGPVKTALLGQFTGDRRVDPDLVSRYTDTLHLRTLTDYRSAGPFGWFAQKIMFTDLLILCTKVMHWLLNVLHFIVPNYGLAIILLTVVVRGLMFPVSRKQAQLSMKMQELAPEMKKLKEKYKNDMRAQHEAAMELQRKHGVNPLGGCLPLLLQMPIFLSLYYCLQESIHFRLAGFLWIRNLAAPDMFLWWSEWLPWLTDPDSQGGVLYLGPYLNLLPIAAVSLMLVQQKMMMPPPADEQQAMQQKMMKYMMIFFGIMFYKVASGLCIYFIASSLWGLAERKLLPKKPVTPGTPAATAAPPPAGGKPFGGPPRGKGPLSGGKPKPGPGKKKGKDQEQESGAMQKVKDWWAEVLKQAKKK